MEARTKLHLIVGSLLKEPDGRPLPREGSRKVRSFRGIQVLRGLAACFVVLHHSTLYWARVTHPVIVGDPSGFWVNGNRGVDIFFVISGFVMMISTANKNAGPAAARTFLERRLLRIFPMYWVATAMFIAWTAFLLRSHINKLAAIFPASWMATSMLLLPTGGLPIDGAGWTLTYEIYFYLLFALALTFRIKPAWFLTIVAIPLIGAGHSHFAWNFIPSTLVPAFSIATSELLLEFLAGMLIGLVVLSGLKLPLPLIASTAILSFAGLLIHDERFLRLPVWHHHRVLMYGFPAAMLVFSVALLEDRFGQFWPKLILLIGDASYSLYLSHLFCLNILIGLFQTSGFLKLGVVRRQDEWLTAMIGLATCLVVALFLYWAIEQPLQIWLRRISKPKADNTLAAA